MQLLLLLWFSTIMINAQSILVNEINSIKSNYSLSAIGKIYFINNTMVILKKNNTSSAFSLNKIANLAFSTNYTKLNEQIIIKNEELKVFPNPAFNILNVDLSNKQEKTGLLYLINIEGAKILEKITRNELMVSLDISKLENGIYFCYYLDSSNVKIAKIIKQ